MRRFTVIFAAVVLALAFSLTSFASTAAPAPVKGYQYGYCVGGHNFMWDADGNIMSRADAEARLDQYIADGYILEDDKDYYLEMYDYCAENGWNNLGCGFGRSNDRVRGGGCCGGRWR